MSECSDAAEDVANKSAELGRAESNLDQAKKSAQDNSGPNLGSDGGTFVACLVTGGLISAATGPGAFVVMTIAGGACLGLSVYNMSQEAAKRDQARQDVRDDQQKVDQAKQALKDALAHQRHACQLADAGCGSRGGPGYRRPDGKCGGWDDWGSGDGDEGNA